jgi:double-stranded uracil-DNA glycosylase
LDCARYYDQDERSNPSAYGVFESQEGTTYISGARGMIRYRYKKPKILFVGINPHPGSFRRSVPFSNNKMFWYLLSDAGLLRETRDELRDDVFLMRLYSEAFNPLYRLGFVNIIDRPTRDITEIRKGEEISGRAKIFRIIQTETPKVVCFIGKVAYEKYTGLKGFTFGWKDPIALSRVFVMHFPLRGEAVVRIRELRMIKQVAEQ